ncbi:MAG: tail fiber domain-containing protein [Planctomycetes bacterium]|nr:tail fiber domain-containing protein [Planctomycetota bacterium]
MIGKRTRWWPGSWALCLVGYVLGGCPPVDDGQDLNALVDQIVEEQLAARSLPQGPPGEQGEPGPSGAAGQAGAGGLACWDLNGNGVGDPDEDANGDGDYNALDCAGSSGPQGMNGPAGLQGPPGLQGLPGARGLACWDSNANGIGDPAEDINGDGAFDALDCTGPPGLQGSAGASPFQLVGNDACYMQGNVGIGTTAPSELLTVAGVVEAMVGGFRFPDGTLQTTAATGGTSGDGIAGSGTPNYIPKFADETTLTDSVITEFGGNVGIGTPDPQAPLDVNGMLRVGELGTTDDRALTLYVNDAPILWMDDVLGDDDGDLFSATNMIAGYGGYDGNSGNQLKAGVIGATICGGGAYEITDATNSPNRVFDHFGTIGGGYANLVGLDSADPWDQLGGTVGGGDHNTASGDHATVAGGKSNIASGDVSTVGGGFANEATAGRTTVSGGWSNVATETAATVGGGRDNNATASYSTVAGGVFNTASGERSSVDGGYLNKASGYGATVGGGSENTASGENACVGGGWKNAASGFDASVVGGVENTSAGNCSFVGGGTHNNVTAEYSVICTGYYNTVTGERAGIVGGQANDASGSYSLIGGGLSNTGSGSYASVLGGKQNTAGETYATVGGGYQNNAGGFAATVPGGEANEAAGSRSFAVGYRAKATEPGTFVWADSSVSADFASTAKNQFLIRADGGVGIGTNDPQGFQLAVNGSAAKPGGGSWSSFSDRRLKKNIAPLAGALTRLLELRGVTYEYKDPQSSLGLPGQQIGLIAQEVEQVFPEWVEEDENGYKYVTVRGLEALVVEALRELRLEKDAQVQALRAENDELRGRLAALEQAVHAMSLAQTISDD